jgi:hypothetical protein
MIFCNTIAMVELMADCIPDSPTHHSEMDVDDRAEVADNFSEGQPRVMITTSGLSAGVDFPFVEAVIHVGTPYTLIDFAQESGRAGRRGQRSYSHVFHQGHRNLPDPDTLGVEYLNEWLGDTGCRRYLLSKFLDGKGVTCASLSGCHLCHHCMPSDSAASSSCTAPSSSAVFKVPDTAPLVKEAESPVMRRSVQAQSQGKRKSSQSTMSPIIRDQTPSAESELPPSPRSKLKVPRLGFPPVIQDSAPRRPLHRIKFGESIYSTTPIPSLICTP